MWMHRCLQTKKPYRIWYVITCGDVWFVSIVRVNVREIFSNFYHSLHMWYMTCRQVSWFLDFVCILYNLKTIRPQVGGRVPWTRCLKFPVSSWIRPHTTLNNMNIIFSITGFHYSMHMQFKFTFSEIIQWNEIN
jgi:hypothetical protein